MFRLWGISIAMLLSWIWGNLTDVKPDYLGDVSDYGFFNRYITHYRIVERGVFRGWSRNGGWAFPDFTPRQTRRYLELQKKLTGLVSAVLVTPYGIRRRVYKSGRRIEILLWILRGLPIALQIPLRAFLTIVIAPESPYARPNKEHPARWGVGDPKGALNLNNRIF